jgi:hypothetical protein
MASRQRPPALFRQRPLAPLRQARDRRQWSRLVEWPVEALSPKATAILRRLTSPVSTFTKWRANTETMLATPAVKADMQDRRMAALEASQANRRANALDVARATAGLLSYAVHGHANTPEVAVPKASRKSGMWLD